MTIANALIALLLALSSAIFLYGGLPFLRGAAGELKRREPGMMTLIGLAVSVAYGYSAAVALGAPGADFPAAESLV